VPRAVLRTHIIQNKASELIGRTTALKWLSITPDRGNHHGDRSKERSTSVSYILSDVLQPTLTVICESCGRRGRYSVARLIEKHGDAKLTTLLDTLTGCPKPRKGDFRDLCKAVYGQTIP
jgi:hypothetical protein